MKQSLSKNRLSNIQPTVETINVCIRVRPLLKNFEDEEVWRIDKQQNSIQSMLDIKQNLFQSIQNLSEISLKERKRLLDAGTTPITFTFGIYSSASDLSSL